MGLLDIIKKPKHPPYRRAFERKWVSYHYGPMVGLGMAIDMAIQDDGLTVDIRVRKEQWNRLDLAEHLRAVLADLEGYSPTKELP